MLRMPRGSLAQRQLATGQLARGDQVCDGDKGVQVAGRIGVAETSARFVVVSGGHIGHLSNVWMKACRRESLTDEQAMAYSVLFGWTGWTPVLMTSFMTSLRQYDVVNMSSYCTV